MAAQARDPSKSLYIQVIIGVVAGAAAGPFLAGDRGADAAVRRRLHQAGADDHRADHLRHRRRRHRQAVGRQGGRAHRPEGDHLLRGDDHVAMFIGLIVGHVVQPGRRAEHRSRDLGQQGGRALRQRAASGRHVDFLLNIIPNTVVDAFAKGEILQVLLFAVLFGLGLSRLGERGQERGAFPRRGRRRAVRRDRHHHARSPRWARSAPWPSPSAATASARWRSSAS